MRFTKISIKNFRALTDIEATLKPRCNVVVGPNAIGKTTFLDAIRLAKGLLAPRSQNEPNQILFALGALNPQIPNSLISSAISSDSNLPVLINCNIQFSSSEIALLEEPTSAVAIATQMLLASMGQQFRSQTERVNDCETGCVRV